MNPKIQKYLTVALGCALSAVAFWPGISPAIAQVLTGLGALLVGKESMHPADSPVNQKPVGPTGPAEPS